MTARKTKKKAAKKATKKTGTKKAVKKAGAKKAAGKKAAARKATTKKAATKKATTKKAATKKTAKAAAGRRKDKVVLLAGGNPQIPKGEGDAPVQAYIAAMPGWKRDVGRRLDKLIERAVPDVRKAVKWNSPFYGASGTEGWFLNFHCFTRYVKVAFLRGASLRPRPPGESKHAHVRYLDIHEDGKFDEAQFSDWAGQASKLPGEKM